MSFWRRSLKNAGFLSLEAALVRGGGVVVTLILARMLTPASWGLFNAIVSANQTLYQLTKLSIDSALHVRFSESRSGTGGLGPGDFAGAGIVAMGALAAFALIASVALAGPVAELFGAPELKPWTIVAGVGAAAQFVSGYGAAALFGAGDFRGVTLVNATATAVYLLLLAAAVLTGAHELWIAVMAFLLFQVGGAAWLGLRGLRALVARGSAPRFSRVGSAARELLRFGLPLYLSSFFPSLAIFFLMAELSRVHGVGALAGLRVAMTLAQLVLFLPAAVGQAFITEFARARSEAAFPKREFGRYLKLVAASTVVTMVAVAAVAPEATPLLFGATYGPAVDAVFFALMAAGIQAVKQPMLIGFISERRTHYALLDAVVSTAAVVPLGFWLVPEYGVGGLLVAQGASQGLSAAALFAIVLWRSFRDPSLRDVLGAAFALAFGLAVTAAGHWTAESAIHPLLFACFLAIAALASLFGLIRRHERERVLAIARELGFGLARARGGSK